jgi:HK97 gp10 family phage protein
MKTLEQVAQTYKTIAQSYIKNSYTGWKKAPYDTGNLYNQVGSFNTMDKMIQQQKGKSFITLNYAPSDAAYGKYVENGTSKMPARPFAYNAANSKEVKMAIKDYQDSQVLDINANVQKRVTVIFGKTMKKV